MSQSRRIRIGLIGADIQRSRSPALHMAEGKAQGLDLSYELIDLTQRKQKPSALPALLAEAEEQGFAGLNITHPCKQRVIPLLDELSVDAGALGAVNTVVFASGRRIGHNTDWSGFLASFRRGLPDVARNSVLQMGAGGAGAAVAHAALHLGVRQLLIGDIDPLRAGALVASLNERAGRSFARVTEDLPAAMAEADGLINTTPMGMDAHPGLPIDANLIAPHHWVADVVYFPLKTALLSVAEAKGCRLLDGSGMAIFQAVDAFRLFTGREPDATRMARTFASLG